MARCHRIGQSKSVKVYRLITSRSYEKEMFIKASKKLGLGQAILEADTGTGGGNSNSFSQKEINELLKYGGIDENDLEKDRHLF